AHWCGDKACMHWVVDCDHVVDPLPIKHVAVDNSCIESVAYDRLNGRLEVAFKWHSTHQYWPVSLEQFRELWKSGPMMNAVLSQKISNQRGTRFEEVRTEGKVLASMLRVVPHVMQPRGW